MKILRETIITLLPLVIVFSLIMIGITNPGTFSIIIDIALGTLLIGMILTGLFGVFYAVLKVIGAVDIED